MIILSLHDRKGKAVQHSEKRYRRTSFIIVFHKFFHKIEAEMFEDFYVKSINFVSKYYGMSSFDSMNELRHKLWVKKVGSANTILPPLERLPPTDACFEQ